LLLPYHGKLLRLLDCFLAFNGKILGIHFCIVLYY
jgi:hypothetical protein